LFARGRFKQIQMDSNTFRISTKGYHVRTQYSSVEYASIISRWCCTIARRLKRRRDDKTLWSITWSLWINAFRHLKDAWGWNLRSHRPYIFRLQGKISKTSPERGFRLTGRV
jgi:hypothetical protein